MGTFFTLGSVDPGSFWVKALIVSEVGLGYSFLALVISYLPVFYDSFSKRELRISLLDAQNATVATFMLGRTASMP